MANTVLQIRRSNTSVTPGVILSDGEFGYSYSTNSLFIGAQSGIGFAGLRIGGTAYSYLYQAGVPGVLTANAVPITDANSFLSNVFTQGLVIQTSTSTPTLLINSISNSGAAYLGANTLGGGIGTELVTSTAITGYVVNRLGALTSVSANQQIQFNDSGSFNGLAGFTYNKATNTVFVGNTLSIGTGFTANATLVNATAINVVNQINAASLNIVNQINAATLYASSTANVGTNILINTTSYGVFGSTSVGNAVLNSSSLSLGNSTVNTIVNSTAFQSGNSSVYTIANSIVDLWVNTPTIGNAVINATTMLIGNSTIYSSANQFADLWVGLVSNASINNSIIQILGTTTVGSVTLNTTAVMVGNSLTNSTLNSTSWSGVANNALYLGGTLAAAYVQNNFTGTLTGSAITFGGTSTTFSTNAIFNANANFGGANHYVSSTNTTITSNTTLAGTNTVISSNLMVTSGLISATSANVSIQNLAVSGNLVVSGTITTINTTDLHVNANFIQLADLNTSTDTVDEGFFGTYKSSGTIYYPGFARIVSLSTATNPYFYVFTTKNNPNTSSTLDLTPANTFTGTIAAYLAPYGVGGAFIVNSTAINITANSQVSSTLSVNTISLSTALSAAYGGTGQLGGYATGDMLYATGASTLGKLTGGMTNGYVLQVSSNLPTWSSIDSGIFMIPLFALISLTTLISYFSSFNALLQYV